jgi:hypothetical protein
MTPPFVETNCTGLCAGQAETARPVPPEFIRSASDPGLASPRADHRCSDAGLESSAKPMERRGAGYVGWRSRQRLGRFAPSGGERASRAAQRANRARRRQSLSQLSGRNGSAIMPARDRGGIAAVLRRKGSSPRGIPWGSSAAARQRHAAKNPSVPPTTNAPAVNAIDIYRLQISADASATNDPSTTNRITNVQFMSASVDDDDLAGSRAASEVVRGLQEGRAKACGRSNQFRRPLQRRGRRTQPSGSEAARSRPRSRSGLRR